MYIFQSFRNLRDRTLSTASSTSLCGVEEDKASEYALTRRRSSARSLASVNTGAMESVMVQVLKQAEFLRAKEEKRYKIYPVIGQHILT